MQKLNKTKAAAIMLLGLGGMVLAIFAFCTADNDTVLRVVAPDRQQAQHDLLHACIFLLGCSCLLIVWGASTWGRLDELERQEAEPKRKEVAA